MNGNERNHRWLKLAARLVLVAALLVVLLRWIDVEELQQVLLATPLWLALVGLLGVLLRMWLTALRWWVMESHDGSRRLSESGPDAPEVPRLTLGMCFRYKWTASAVNLFGPAAVGPDLGRMALVAYEHTGHRVERSVVIVMDRLVGMFSLGVLGFAAGVLAPNLKQRGIYLLVVGAFVVVLLVALLGAQTAPGRAFNRWLATSWGAPGAKAAGLIEIWAASSESLRKNPTTLTWALLISVVTHMVSFSLVYLTAMVYGASGSFYTYSIVTAISWLVTFIPLGVGGLGLRELSFVVQLAPQGVTPALATAISLFQFATTNIVSASGVPLILFSKRRSLGSSSGESLPTEGQATHGT